MTFLELVFGSALAVLILTVLFAVMVNAYNKGIVVPGFKVSCTLWLCTLLVGATIVGVVVWVTKLLYGG